jgi:hypothetical protein
MYEERRFVLTPDDGVVLWRYLDIVKFVDLLQTSTLHFSRADLVGDDFEGSYTQGNKTWYKKYFRDLYGKDAGDEWIDNVAAFNRGLPKWIYLNCWHMNSDESAAMWQQYGPVAGSIAIRSTVGSLKKALAKASEPIHIGAVTYISYQNDKFPDAHPLHAFLHKRTSFAHEKEARAIFVNYEAQDKPFALPTSAPAEGIRVKTTLKDLVQAVHVAPRAQQWVVQVVDRLLDTHGVGIRATQSAMDVAPLF